MAAIDVEIFVSAPRAEDGRPCREFGLLVEPFDTVSFGLGPNSLESDFRIGESVAFRVAGIEKAMPVVTRATLLWFDWPKI